VSDDEDRAEQVGPDGLLVDEVDERRIGHAVERVVVQALPAAPRPQLVWIPRREDVDPRTIALVDEETI
jgi:hypothetical protein